MSKYLYVVNYINFNMVTQLLKNCYKGAKNCFILKPLLEITITSSYYEKLSLGRIMVIIFCTLVKLIIIIRIWEKMNYAVRKKLIYTYATYILPWPKSNRNGGIKERYQFISQKLLHLLLRYLLRLQFTSANIFTRVCASFCS